MAWLDWVPPDTTRIVLEQVTLGGSPSAVVAAVFVVHRADGTAVRRRQSLRPVAYETLVDDLRALNRLLRGRR